MADLEAVLADVSYLMAMEKSKSSNNQHRASRKMTLPDPSVKSVMLRHLQDRDELRFDVLIKQRLAYLLFKEYCQRNHDRKFDLYHKLNKLANLYNKDDRREHERALIDSYFSSPVVVDQLLGRPIVYKEIVENSECSESRTVEKVVVPDTKTSDGGKLVDNKKVKDSEKNEKTEKNNKKYKLNTKHPKAELRITSKFLRGKNQTPINSLNNSKEVSPSKNEGAHRSRNSSPERPNSPQVIVKEYFMPEGVLADIKSRVGKLKSLHNNPNVQQSHNTQINSSKSKSSTTIVSSSSTIHNKSLINDQSSASQSSTLCSTTPLITSHNNTFEGNDPDLHEKRKLNSSVDALKSSSSKYNTNTILETTNNTSKSSSQFLTNSSSQISNSQNSQISQITQITQISSVTIQPALPSSPHKPQHELTAANSQISQNSVPRYSEISTSDKSELPLSYTQQTISTNISSISPSNSYSSNLPESLPSKGHETPQNALKNSINTLQTHSTTHSVYKEFPFQHVQDYLQLYLKHSVYPQFIKSDQFARFTQWKNVELSIQLGMNDFSVHRIIGRGGFGEVYGCRKADTGKMYAMKCLDKKRIKLKQGEMLALNERFILQLVSSGSEVCNFIVGMTYAFTTPYKVCFLLDLMNGGDLHYHLTQHIFTEEEVRFYVAEVALGLEHMHSRGVVYRDLKPANILLAENGHVRISDLGLACDFLHKRPHASVGTHGYMAPEVLQRGVAYDSSADWFSLGCMIYKLLRGHSPFRPHRNKDKYEIDRLTLVKEVEMPQTFSEELKDLLNKLLIKDPRDRLCCTGNDPTQGASELKNTSFFQDVNWDIMKNMGYPAPMIPPRGEVNAHDAFDIGNFDDDETKGIKLSDQDQKMWDNFHVVVSDRWQREIGETVFDQVNSESDRAEEKRRKGKGSKYPGGDDAQGLTGTFKNVMSKIFGMKESDDCYHSASSNNVSNTYASGKDCIMHGYVYKLGGPFNTQWQRKYFYLFPNRIESIGEENSLLAIEQINGIDSVQYRGYKCLQIKVRNSSKMNIFLRFETEPEYLQWRKELTICFTEVHRLNKRGPKLIKTAVSVHEEVTHNQAVARSRGDIPSSSISQAMNHFHHHIHHHVHSHQPVEETSDTRIATSEFSSSTGHIYMGPTSEAERTEMLAAQNAHLSQQNYEQ